MEIILFILLVYAVVGLLYGTLVLTGAVLPLFVQGLGLIIILPFAFIKSVYDAFSKKNKFYKKRWFGLSIALAWVWLIYVSI